MINIAIDKKKIASYVDVDENTPIIKLSVKDQLRVMISRMSHDDARELENEDEYSIHEMQIRATLEDFLRKATEPIRNGQHESVTLKISSEFDSVLDEVLASPEIQRYYFVKLVRPDVNYDVHYNVLVRLEVRKD